MRREGGGVVSGSNVHCGNGHVIQWSLGKEGCGCDSEGVCGGIWKQSSVTFFREIVRLRRLKLKLRFHLFVMRMRMMNGNATKNRKHRISTGVLPFVHIRIRSTTTKYDDKMNPYMSNRCECKHFVGSENPVVHMTAAE